MIPHKDGKGIQGIIVTLHSCAQLDFYEMVEEWTPHYTQVYTQADVTKIDTPPVRVLLMPRSVLVLTGKSFTGSLLLEWRGVEWSGVTLIHSVCLSVM
jgi:hypothetical protein